MLKHCSQSCTDVSRTSPLRHTVSLSLDPVFTNAAAAGHSISHSDLATNNRRRHTPSPRLAQGQPGQHRRETGGGGWDSCDSLLNQSTPMMSNNSSRAIRVFAECLWPHLAYKTVIVSPQTTARQVVVGLLGRYRSKHRDPNLFYLTMEVSMSEADADQPRTIGLEDATVISDIIACNPWGTSRFRLKARPGRRVKIHDGLVRPDSVYKSIIVSEETTVADTITILRSCYNTMTREQQQQDVYQLFEVNDLTGQERLLAIDERLLEVTEDWTGEDNIIQLRRSIFAPGSHISCGSSCGGDSDSSCGNNTFSRCGGSSDGSLPKRRNFPRTVLKTAAVQQSIRKKQFLKSMMAPQQLEQQQEQQQGQQQNFQSHHLAVEQSLEAQGLEDRLSHPRRTASEDSGEDGESIDLSSDLNSSTSGVSSISSCSISLESLVNPFDNV